jgi:YfiH family protein
MFPNANIQVRLFDRRFTASTHVYGLLRDLEEKQYKEILANYQAVKSALKVDNLLILDHVHGARVIDADQMVDYTHEPQADAAVTTLPHLALTALSADCVPILLADDEKNIIGAAHCGWRSAKDNVLANAVEMMKLKGATKISALIGPAIHQESYEVDQSFYEAFIEVDRHSQCLFIPSIKRGHYLFDLPGFCKSKLKALGISNIIDLCENTYTNDYYPSFRRDTHAGIMDNMENILSTIVIKP